MEALFKSNFTWWHCFSVALLLLLLYFVLHFLSNVLPKLILSERIHSPIKKFIDNLLLVYEPLAAIILISMFVMIDPQLHGLIIGILLIGGFSHIRDYLSGRIVQFDTNFGVGKKISFQNSRGVIAQIERLGLKVKTNNGLQFVRYSQLLAQGFILMSGEEIGGFYQLKINPLVPEEKVDYAMRLTDLLATTPYLDWNHKPELLSSKEGHELKARISMKEEGHLHDLISLIEEWGYTVKIINKKI